MWRKSTTCVLLSEDAVPKKSRQGRSFFGLGCRWYARVFLRNAHEADACCLYSRGGKSESLPPLAPNFLKVVGTFPAMTERHQWILMAIALAGLVLWFVLGTLPRYREAQRLRADLARGSTWAEKDQGLHKEFNQLAQAVERAEKLLAAFPGKEASFQGGALMTLTEAAAAAGVQLTKFAPLTSSRDPETEKERRQIQISWSGSFTATVDFLKRIEGPPHFMRIRDIVWRKKDIEGEILEAEAICEEEVDRKDVFKNSQLFH